MTKITAYSHSENWAQKPSPKRIAVIQGDPNKQDLMKPSSIFDEDDFTTIDRLKESLQSLKDEYEFIYLSDHTTLLDDLIAIKGQILFAFNLCDEGWNNIPTQELHIPAMLEMLGIPYTGAGPQCLASCYDKSMVRGCAQEIGVPVPGGYFIAPEANAFKLPLKFPVIIKPNFGDSSIGISSKSVAHTYDELLSGINSIREKIGYDKPLLVEDFLEGAEVTIGIIGNPSTSYSILPIIEEDYSALPDDLPKICGYEAKWNHDSPYFQYLKSKHAQLPDGIENLIVYCSRRLFQRLQCRDYARFDWRLDSQGNPKLLEANPNPGWCWDGHLAKMSAIAGLDYASMLRMILRAAEDRILPKPCN